MNDKLVAFVKRRYKQLELTQVDIASRAGAGLRFIRDLKQRKQTLCMGTNRTESSSLAIKISVLDSFNSLFICLKRYLYR
jgi:hypothetical protein